MTGWVDLDHLPIASGDALDLAACAGDILIRWDNVLGEGDWVLALGDLATGQDLETACLVSLFTDRLATPDFVPTDGTTDRRGWWADPYNATPTGSNLWQLLRGKKTRDTLGTARRYTLDALQWLVTDGVAASIACDTTWLGRAGSTVLGIAVLITQPNGTTTRFMFAWAWQGLAVLQSPIAVPPVSPQRVALRR
jgi:phage gp46-like protein